MKLPLLLSVLISLLLIYPCQSQQHLSYAEWRQSISDSELLMAQSNLVNKIINSPMNDFSSNIQFGTSNAIVGVYLSGGDINPKNIYIASTIPTLKSFGLRCCTNEINIIDEQSFYALTNALHLKNLEIYSGVPLLTKAMCDAILSITQLESIVVEFTKIQKGGLPKSQKFRIQE